jgi:hypothetical protein
VFSQDLIAFLTEMYHTNNGNFVVLMLLDDSMYDKKGRQLLESILEVFELIKKTPPKENSTVTRNETQKYKKQSILMWKISHK